MFMNESTLDRTAYLEKCMYKIWLKAGGATNDDQIRHLKNCIKIAVRECLSEKQFLYLSDYMSGYNSREIAKKHGVDQSTISRTLNRALDNLFSRIKYATPGTLRCEKRVRSYLTRLYK